MVLAWRTRAASGPPLWIIAFGCCLAVLIVVLTDIGAGWNQLVDPVVLTALGVGYVAGRARTVRPYTLVALMVVWVNLGTFAETLAPDTQTAMSVLRGSAPAGYSPRPFEGLASSATPILSEDPYVPVSLGQQPVVLDPFMLLRIGRRTPSAVQTLVDRIRAQEFELVVLVEPLEPVARQWWADVHLGANVAEALDNCYVADGRVEGYYVYRPRSSAGCTEAH